MTFQPNIPQPGDLISVSQDAILQNFQALSTSWQVNHVNFNATGDGKHKYIQFPNQSSVPTGAAGEMLIYSDTTSGQSDLWYKRNNGTEIQLTGKDPVKSASGYTFLAGGMLMQWKLVASPSDGDAVSFPIAFSGTPYSLQLTAQRNGTSAGDVNGTSLTASGFTLKLGSNSNSGVWVLAVGPA